MEVALPVVTTGGGLWVVKLKIFPSANPAALDAINRK
jgi:hypothetical protein